ncbi:MAG: TonB-dependent receptor [Rubrivivax sp.]|nr:TonB-dependent receptor [Rubrivivax sp.]
MAFRIASPRLTPVSAAVLGVLMGGTLPAQAQQAGAPSETVVITGIRRAIETSVTTKREQDAIVEAISSEDIGKLPETSIAESLARLPGLTAQRVSGRDQVISIRGLAPKFGVTLLNGREIVSTGDNRSVEYDQFPAELINGAVVYKTPDAALGAQGLSGTVNMKTLRPLDLRGRQINLAVRGEKNSFGAQVPGSKATGNRVSVSYVDQFADNTLGVALGFAHLDSPNQERYFKHWWWGNSAIWGGAFRGLENADPAKAPSTLQGFEMGATSVENKRDGAIAVLEYKPNKNLRTQVDLYYSKFGQRSQGRELQSDLGPNWSGNGTPGNIPNGGPIYSNVSTTTMGNDAVLTGGRVTNVDPLVLSRYGKRDDKVTAIGWNTEMGLGDWKAVADLSWSKASRDEQVGEAYASAVANTGFDFALNPFGTGFSKMTPLLDFGSPAAMLLRGKAAWGNLAGVGQAGSLSPISVDDEMKGLRLAARTSLTFGPFVSFEGGVNYTDRTKDNHREQTIFALKNGSACAASDVCTSFPAGLLQSPVNLGFAGAPSVVSFDMMSAIAAGVYNSGPDNVQLAPGRIWSVNEKVTTAFVKAGLEFDALVPVRGNIGLQFVRTQQGSDGKAWDSVARNTKSMHFGKSYDDTLPSLNLTAEVTPTTLVRLGWAKTLARPNLEDMRAGFTASVATSGASLGQWSGSGGNPFLEPWRATATDLSIEKYFGKRSYIGLAAFKKKLKTSIYVDNTLFDFAGFPNSTGTPQACLTGQTVCSIGNLTAPINGQGGNIEGVELTVSLDFGIVAKALDGFGAVLSASHNHSNLPGRANDGKKDLKRTIEGLSGDVWSMVVYYEGHGFSARFGQRYRSKYMAEVRGVWIDNSLSAIESEKISDAQIGYSWDSGPLKGLGLLLQVNNLSNTPYRTSLADDSSSSTPLRMMPERYIEYGRRYLLGATYKF